MNLDQIHRLYESRRSRYQARDDRMRRTRDALKGDLNAEMRRLGADSREPAVANLMSAAVRTIAQRVGKPPRLHATSILPESDRQKKRIERHEKAIAQRLERMHFAALLPQAAFWLAPSGYLPLVLVHDPRLGHSRIRIRDPLTCYPSTVWPHEPGVEDCLFVSRMTTAEVMAAFPEEAHDLGDGGETVTVTEYHGKDEIIIAITEPDTKLIKRYENKTGQCNVWIARDLTPDFDFYGQFDQVVPIMQAEARLMALVEAYAEQQVAAETNVVGEITSNGGDYAVGLGAVNVLEPAPGVGVTKNTNNMSPQVFQELAFFERAQRNTGNMTLGMSGESDLSFATGRGIEKLNAPVDDNVGHYQNILGLTLYEVINAIPDFEMSHGVDNPGFAPDVRVQVQFMAGADPATTVRHLQLVGSKLLSRRTAVDNLPEVNNPEEEEARIAQEALREAMLTNILGQAQQGMADPKLLIMLTKAVSGDVALEDALAKYYEKVEEAAAEAAAAAPVADPAAAAAAGPMGEQPASLESLFGLSPAGNAVGGVMGNAPI